MSQKNETISLLLALVIAIGIIGGVSWWILGKLGVGEQNPPSGTQQNNSPESARSQPPKTFAEVQGVPSGLFSYGGSTTWAPIRKEVDAVIESVFPEFRLRYTDPTIGAPGSGSGIKMLLNNQLAFSQSSRPLKQEEYQQASERGFTFKEIPVAFDAIAVAIHPNLNLSGITVAQLKDIYTGKITNWNQVGGPNLAIVPYSRRIEEGGTIEFFVENVLEGENFGENVEFIPTTTQALRKISETPGSIYYASAPEVVPQCTVKSLPLGQKTGEWVAPYQEPFIDLSQCPQKRNQLNQTAFQKGEYPITRRLFVIVKQNGQADEQAGVAYANLLLTRQGQDLITKTGFVSIR